MGDEQISKPALADLIDELVDLKMALRQWEESMSRASDRRIEEIKNRIEAVKEMINADISGR